MSLCVYRHDIIWQLTSVLESNLRMCEWSLAGSTRVLLLGANYANEGVRVRTSPLHLNVSTYLRHRLKWWQFHANKLARPECTCRIAQ